jgi:hypothetical protein
VYFVTTKLEGYVLFSMTPSERAALGLTDKQEVHLLTRDPATSTWNVMARWSANEFSHTDFMTAWHRRSEPTEINELLDVLPGELRARLVRND